MDYRVINLYTLKDVLDDYEANDMCDCELYEKLLKIYKGEEE